MVVFDVLDFNLVMDLNFSIVMEGVVVNVF